MQPVHQAAQVNGGDIGIGDDERASPRRKRCNGIQPFRQRAAPDQDVIGATGQRNVDGREPCCRIDGRQGSVSGLVATAAPGGMG